MDNADNYFLKILTKAFVHTIYNLQREQSAYRLIAKI